MQTRNGEIHQQQEIIAVMFVQMKHMTLIETSFTVQIKRHAEFECFFVDLIEVLYCSSSAFNYEKEIK